MNENAICQSCAITLNENILGSNVDGSLSTDYCGYCFQGGNFVDNLTLEQAILNIAEEADKAGVTREEAIRFATNNLPKLKRWRQY